MCDDAPVLGCGYPPFAPEIGAQGSASVTGKVMGAAREQSGRPHEGSTGHMRSMLGRAHEACIAMDAGGFVIDWNLQAQQMVARVRAAKPEGQTRSAGLAVFSGSESAEELVSRANAAL